MKKRVLVTAALPYANGSIHLGHMLEAVQTDVYVRARKLAGEDVIFMWADDTHGTAIQLRARAEGISPEELIARVHDEHVADYTDFGIGFDIYYSTHSEEARRHSSAIFEAMEARGDIVARDVEQLYCDQDQMFLPDRFVRGTCPKCSAADQYGDNCEVCGSTYEPTDLKDPRCSTCGSTPTLKKSEHLFVPLVRHEEFLRRWLTGDEPVAARLEEAVRRYVMHWVDGGLREWDISRDGPYFGFEIPGHPGKFFYVWFDAPIGYIAATEKWCAQTGANFDAYWKAPGSDDVEIVHVIGKDIVYFHCLFWPAMLHAAGYTTPREVHVHGWLTVNGEKMSKSRGTFILARKYLEFLPPDYLRYYFAAKLGSAQDDIDLSIEDFVNRVNADLVKKAANLASRCAKLLKGKLEGRLGEPAADAIELLERARRRLAEAPGLYRSFEYARATRSAMEIAEELNLYLTEAAPWSAVKSDPERARAVLSAGLGGCKIIAAILAPVLPAWAEKTSRYLSLAEPLDFANAATALPAGHVIGDYEALAEPIQLESFQALVEASKESLTAEPAYEVAPLTPECSIDDFVKVDLRIGRVDRCERVEGADKLLRVEVDLGPLGRRTVFAGIAKSYEPEALLGKHVVVCANLKPRKMRFGVSEGMILAAGQSADGVTVLEADPKSLPGDRVK